MYYLVLDRATGIIIDGQKEESEGDVLEAKVGKTE